jgi:spore coat polysaccharide biosynthesis protein SpsF
VFRGDESDVLDRYWRAAQFVGADTVVRITADCPLIDPSLIDDVVRGFLQSSADYASNVLERTYPRGLDVEVISATALERAWRDADQPHQREHVTPYFYENPGLFKLLSVRGKTDCTAYRWTLDTDEDLHLIRTIYERFDGKDDFSWTDALRLMEQEPKLLSINSAIIQKAVRDA